ncbi:unnamed protein product, partial [Allacma fusca]
SELQQSILPQRLHRKGNKMCSRVLVPFHNHGLNSWGLEPSRTLFSPLSYNNSLSVFDDAFLGVDQRLSKLRRELNFSDFPKFNRVSFGLNGEVVTEGNEKKFKLNVPVGDFPPEDVK